MSSIPQNPRNARSPRPSRPFRTSARAVAAKDSASARLAAIVLIGAGVLLVIGALLADPLGISGGGEGFGWKQLIAAIAGLVLAALGTGLLLGAFSRRGSPTLREPLVPLDET